MLRYTILLLTALLAVGSLSSALAQNTNYLSNRAPLEATPFVALPLGTVRADGWLRRQLEFQKDGLTGEAESLYADALGDRSAWLGGNQADWEQGPYYAKGLLSLAYVLEDYGLRAKAQRYVDWVIQSQRSDGNFGPTTNVDWWPRMIVIYYMRDYYEATEDARALTFLERYFEFQRNTIDGTDLQEWGKARAGDNMEVVLWCYNVTGREWLLELAQKLKEKAFDWTDIYTTNSFYDLGEFHSYHGVNVAQAFKLPAVYYQLSKSSADRDAYARGMEHLMEERGRPDGMFSNSEHLRGRYSTSGSELCSVVEQMLSAETTLRITGSAEIGDHLEKLAFNALPAHLSPNLKQFTYYNLPNNVVSKAENGHLDFSDEHGNNHAPGPYSGFPCCRYNWHMGWPLFVKHLWMGTQDNGLAVVAYAPSTIRAKVGNGTDVTIREETNYPFEETIKLTVSVAQNTTFPLKLRIPAWCQNPQVAVNGSAQGGVVSGEFYVINRDWNSGDVVTVAFPATVKATDWANNSVGLERGPLVYSLRIEEDWQIKTFYENDFSEFEVFPRSAWNYGLLLDRENPEASTEVSRGGMSDEPFGDAPIRITARAKKIPGWTLTDNGVQANEPPASPVSSSQPEETVTLVPYGSRNLRVTNFPVLAAGRVYEAEEATTNNTDAPAASGYASGGRFIAGIDDADSYIEFGEVNLAEAGTYRLALGYANGTGAPSTFILTINGATEEVSLPATAGWSLFGVAYLDVYLETDNVIRVTKGNSFAQLDYLSVERSEGGGGTSNDDKSGPFYEAEEAVINGAAVNTANAASENRYVGGIDLEDSYVEFANVTVPTDGTYSLSVAYANGFAEPSSHRMTVNQGPPITVTYSATGGWEQFFVTSTDVQLRAGSNTIRLAKGDGFATLDFVGINTGIALGDGEAPGFGGLADRLHAASLDGFYNPDGPYFQQSNGGESRFHYWWNAHALDALTDRYLRNREGAALMKDLLRGIRTRNNGTYIIDFYDDMEWLAIATLRAYEATGDTEYLDVSNELWEDIRGGRSTDGFGGAIQWSKACKECKNAISNTTAVLYAARRYRRLGAPEDLRIARELFTWLKETLVDPASGAVWDNLNANTGVIDRNAFSYNQGTYLAAALELYLSTGEANFMDDAIKTADYAVSNTTDGVLYTSEAGGMDGGLFKGILVRYLAQLVREGELPATERAGYANVIRTNAETLRRRGVNYLNLTVSTNWAIPPGVATDYSTQLSGTMLAEAAATLDQVAVYEHASYDGARAYLQQGSYGTAALAALGMGDNAVSSLTVPSGYRVTVYDGDGFTGESVTYGANEPWVGVWNDRVSSLIVEPDGVGSYGFGGRGAGDDPGAGTPNSSLKIHPNPASNRIYLDFGEGRAKVSMVDVSGKTVVDKRLVEAGTALDISHLAAGVYVVTVETTTRTARGKLIKR